MPKFKSIPEIEKWFAERIVSTRKRFENLAACKCEKMNCSACKLKALVRDKIEDLAIQAGFEVEFFKEQEMNNMAISYAEERSPRDVITIEAMNQRNMEIETRKDCRARALVHCSDSRERSMNQLGESLRDISKLCNLFGQTHIKAHTRDSKDKE
jgi:hypothetical protein